MVPGAVIQFVSWFGSCSELRRIRLDSPVVTIRGMVVFCMHRVVVVVLVVADRIRMRRASRNCYLLPLSTNKMSREYNFYE
jgi:hypothetical protein